MNKSLAIALAALPAIAGCSQPAEAPIESTPQNAFWSALSSHCGNAYPGEIVSEDERDADWQGKRMIAHWAKCSENVISIAFHIEDPEREDGWDRSRTWIVARTDTFTSTETIAGTTRSHSRGLHLKHDHRHDDGKADAVTFYGGHSDHEGSAGAQDFPVDQKSIELFGREGLDASLTNVWRLEVDPAGSENARFVYQLTRRNDPTRQFRVQFDASEPVEAPPPAWGWEVDSTQ